MKQTSREQNLSRQLLKIRAAEHLNEMRRRPLSTRLSVALADLDDLLKKMAIPFDQKHKILAEVYRNYLTFRDHFARTGQDTIKHGPLTISFLDLQYGLSELAPRKKEAVWLNVICDMKQKDVAKIMGITTVTVGQYVKQAMLSLCKRYWDDDEADLP